MRSSLATDIVLSAALSLVAAIILVFGSWGVFTRYAPAWVQESALAETADHLMEGLLFDAQGHPVAVDVRQDFRPVLDALPLDFLYQVVDERGHVLLSSSGNPEPLLLSNWTPVAAPTVYESTRAGVKLHVIAVPISQSKIPAYFLVGRSQRFDERLFEYESSTVRFAVLLAVVATLAIFAAVVLVAVSRLMRRLREISVKAAQVEPTNFAARLSIDKVPKEIVPLIEAFNSALARLENGYRVQQDFLATAAHELKTPLALMRGELEMDGDLDKSILLKDLDHMTRQVHQLLHLAEVSDESNFFVATVDAIRVVEDTVDFLSRLTQAKGLSIELQRLSGEVMIRADRGALFVLMRNLIENAIHHSPRYSIISVSVGEEGVAVRDQGVGVPEKDMPMLFNRFWRGAHRRDEGAGLGLSICREVARAHGWALSVKSAQPGTIFKVHFKLPQ